MSKALRRPPVGAAAVIEANAALDDSVAPLIQRPDGWYWLAPGGKQSFGPFTSAAQARADRDAYDDSAPEPGESLGEAESELDLADWIDPDTGSLAEGQSIPHLPSD